MKRPTFESNSAPPRRVSRPAFRCPAPRRVPAANSALPLAVLAACLFLLPSRPAAQPPSDPPPAGPPVGLTGGGFRAGFDIPLPASVKVLRAVHVDPAPVLDGRVLDDPAWDAAVPARGFQQTFPDDGARATERTHVRAVFTAEAVYFGVVCYDRDPAALVVSDSSRDSPLEDADSFLMILDTFADGQNGFVFGTTPDGQEYDGQVVNEGQSPGRPGMASTSGPGGGFNLAWDGVWQVRTAVGDFGWSAEFEIPFRTLRYPAQSLQVWGVNFQRNIARRAEVAYWAPLPRQSNLYRVSMAGRLGGLFPPRGGRSLQATPYVTAGAARPAGSAAGPQAVRRDFAYGADLRYGVTSALTLDGTFNTDFGQVEVDDEQINLDRFSLFFPEKRPFFLENAGLFALSVPIDSLWRRRMEQTHLFFSRRIGIGDDGTPIPIRAGARLSGTLSEGLTVGVINMQTEAVEGVAPANNFTVSRVRRELPGRSSIGALFVNRQAGGPSAGLADHNRTYAVDGRWGVGDNGLVSGFYGGTNTPGLTGRDHALRVSGTYTSEVWRLAAGYRENGEDFNPEVGFASRTGFRSYDLLAQTTLRPRRVLRELQPRLAYTRFWNFDGVTESALLRGSLDTELPDGSGTDFNHYVRSEQVFDAYSVSGLSVPPGRYDWTVTEAEFEYDASAPVGGGIAVQAGGFFGGSIVTVNPTFRARLGQALHAELDYSRHHIALPSGSTVTNLAGLRAGYNFTARISAQTLLQYNDSADLWSVNFRFAWLLGANTGLFVVYNETDGLSDRVGPGAGRRLLVKFTRMFDVLD